MNWLNLNVSVLDSPEFLGAEPIQRATWLCLLRYCVGQENGGEIQDCREWRDRQWQQVVRVTKEEVMAESDLWTWNGGGIVVAFYPNEKEREVQAMRSIGQSKTDKKAAAARENGRNGGRPAKETQRKPNDKPNGEKPSDEKNNPTETHRIEEKGIEENLFGFLEGENPEPKAQKPFLPESVAVEIRKLYRRRESTPWTPDDIKAAGRIRSIPESELLADLALMVKARAKGWTAHRQDPATLMNNWQVEIDRANNHLKHNPSKIDF